MAVRSQRQHTLGQYWTLLSTMSGMSVPDFASHVRRLIRCDCTWLEAIEVPPSKLSCSDRCTIRSLSTISRSVPHSVYHSLAQYRTP
eukprot:2108559-Rhodomonas_salina.1